MDFDKIKELLNKRKQDKQAVKLLNLDTMRLVKEENVIVRKPTHLSKKLGIFSEDKDKFNDVKKFLTKPTSPVSPVEIDNSKVSNRARDRPKSTPVKQYNLRPRIPKDIRKEIWRIYAVDERCFCCLEPLLETKYEAGHIKPYAHGGSDTVDNLRPICFDCNRSMSSLHMYEYMFRHNKRGLINLKIDRAYIFFRGLVDQCQRAQTKLAQLVAQQKITKTEGEKRRNELFSTNQTIDSRIELLNAIKNM